MPSKKKNTRVAVVAGLRTPFARQRTAFKDLSALELAVMVVAELLQRAEIHPAEVDRVVYGQVIPSLRAPNIAREVVLGTGMPPRVEAFSVARACATGYQAAASVADAISTGEIECGIAGGADSASTIPMAVSGALAGALLAASKARSMKDRVAAFAGLRPKDLVPVAPALEEPSTGLTMGESAEQMAKENGIGRDAQDAFAHGSHAKAARAWEEGVFAEQVMPAYVPPGFGPLLEDNLVRRDSAPEAYARLEPVFDRRHGTVTAGNSSPLTDGASALLLMREDKAEALGLPVLGFIRGHAFAGLAPWGQMLLGPAHATPRVLDRCGMALADMELVDMHEAFAAQVLSNLQALESERFAWEALGREQAVGAIDPGRLNVSGGSIALGHPFAATGARQILQLLHDLRRSGLGLGLCTACAAGGLGAAMILEVA